jgi:hypothetical protein
VQIIFKNEKDEVLSTFPMFEEVFNKVEMQCFKFDEEINAELARLKPFYDLPMEKRQDKEIKKQFALSMNKKFSVFLFATFNNGISLREYYESESLKKKSFFKLMYENYISKY